MNEPWRIALFGGLSARQGDKAVTRFKSQKVASLLAYLAVHLRQTHSREFLIELLWPEGTVEAGRNSLSVALSSLRHQFEPPGTPANAVVRADRFSVSLNPAAVRTDVTEFEEAVRASARPQVSERERGEHLTRAVELYQGRLLPHLYDEWITAEQERLSALFREAASRLVRAREGAGDVESAVTYARRTVSLEPLQEEAQLALIRLLDASGQPGAALRQYREYERLLGDMADEPGAALRALARQIERRTGLTAPAAMTALTPPPAALRPPVAPLVGPITLTFLLTDIEGSTKEWVKGGDAYREALREHHRLLRETFARYGGQEVQEAGDGFLVAFAGAVPALRCAVEAQQALAAHPWPEAVGSVRVRMALHSGDVERGEIGEYQGLALHRASRLLSAAHGGQTLLSEETAGLVRRDLPSEVSLRDLGMFRLRDLPGPERLFQAEHPGMAQAVFPALRAEAGHASGIPLTFTRFFGRERELARLGELLRPERERLVTVTGPGGNGKTRVAIEAARRASDAFAGAVWFVPLADLSDPALIAGAVLDTLRVPRSPQQEPLEQAVVALNKQPSLLVLDNFEQLVENGGDEVVNALLSRVPSLTMLVTSRQVLGLSGEREFALSPLPTPFTGAGKDAEGLSAYDSVQLFIDRAQQVKPDFQVTNANAAAVAELVTRLEGIPLAIELAAARALVLTPSQMLAQMENRFTFLAGRKRDVVERHRTLHAAVDWSYQLLSPELQRFFCRLSVFRGGWTSEAAEAVCEEPLALDYLAQLGECSLVLSQEAEQGMRFHMLETLHEFGWEQLRAEEKPLLARAHAEHFKAITERAGKHAHHPDVATQVWWNRRLDAELENVRAAFVWSQGDGGDPELGLWLALDVSRYRAVRGYWRESRQAIETAMARLPNLEGEKRLWAVDALVQTLYMMGEHEKCWPLLAESLELAQAVGTRSNVAWSLGGLGRWGEALEIFREIGDFHGQVNALQNLHYGALLRGDLATANARLEEAMALARQGHSDPALILGQMAVILALRGEYEQAIAYQTEALAFCEEMGHRDLLADCHARLGNHWLQIGDFTKARRHLNHAVEILREVGSKPAHSACQVHLAWVALREGDTEAARRLAQESLDLAQETGRREVTASALDILGRLCLLQGQAALARPYFERSLRSLAEGGSPQSIAYSLESWAHLAIAEGSSEGAVRLISVTEALRKKLGMPLPPVEQPEQAALLETARASLREEAFAAAWEAGKQMGWAAAAALALGETVQQKSGEDFLRSPGI